MSRKYHLTGEEKDKKLTEAGRKQAKILGKAVADSKIVFDRIVVR
jgi:broad specificity phosphatase PhoE